MKSLIEGFSRHIGESIVIAEKSPLKLTPAPFKNVVISGLGGSGIGGTIVADIARPLATVPIIINKDYVIPAFVDSGTLFIASSYSGGTEETLQAVEEARLKGAQIVCITSGGKLQEFAQHHGYDVRIIPGGNPPRACLGYSFTQLISILSELEIIPTQVYRDLGKAIAFLDAHEEDIRKEAVAFAKHIHDKMPIIYAEGATDGVAVRFRQQLNENSKMLCWHHIVPEMNHNELVGWTQQNDQLAVIFMRNTTDYNRNQTRMDINKTIVAKFTPNVYELWAKGDNAIERALYLIHLGDWISYELSEIRKVDIMDIKVIDYLKGELAKI